MNKIIHIFCLLISLVILGCAEKEELLSPLEEKYTTISPDQVIHFPRRYAPRFGTYNASAVEGQLILDNGCIRVKTELPKLRHPPINKFIYATMIWPHNYRYEIKDGLLTIKAVNEKIVAILGRHVRFGGGSGSPETLENYEDLHKILSHCPQPYFLVTPL